MRAAVRFAGVIQRTIVIVSGLLLHQLTRDGIDDVAGRRMVCVRPTAIGFERAVHQLRGDELRLAPLHLESLGGAARRHSQLPHEILRTGRNPQAKTADPWRSAARQMHRSRALCLLQAAAKITGVVTRCSLVRCRS